MIHFIHFILTAPVLLALKLLQIEADGSPFTRPFFLSSVYAPFLSVHKQ